MGEGQGPFPTAIFSTVPWNKRGINREPEANPACNYMNECSFRGIHTHKKKNLHGEYSYSVTTWTFKMLAFSIYQWKGRDPAM